MDHLMFHEICTQLNAINGFTDLCFSEGVDDGMRMEFQKEIQANTYRLTGLLDTMLELSKLVGSTETLPAEETDVYGICMRQMEVLRLINTKVDAFVPGTGLGLYLCRLIIKKLGGWISIVPPINRAVV